MIVAFFIIQFSAQNSSVLHLNFSISKLLKLLKNFFKAIFQKFPKTKIKKAQKPRINSKFNSNQFQNQNKVYTNLLIFETLALCQSEKLKSYKPCGDFFYFPIFLFFYFKIEIYVKK